VPLLVVEDAASGTQLIDTIRSRDAEIPFIAAKAVAAKIIRGEGVTPITTGGLGALPCDAEWRADFITELSNFPVGVHDDVCDVSGAAVVADQQQTGVLHGAAAWATMTMIYSTMVRYYRLNPAWALALPLAALFYLGATVHSAVKYWNGSGERASPGQSRSACYRNSPPLDLSMIEHPTLCKSRYS
jgi:hypothetical protein